MKLRLQNVIKSETMITASNRENFSSFQTDNKSKKNISG